MATFMAEPNRNKSASATASDASNAAACLEALSFSPPPKKLSNAPSVPVASTSTATISEPPSWSDALADMIPQKGVPFSEQDGTMHSATLQPSISTEEPSPVPSANDAVANSGKGMIERKPEEMIQPSATVPSQFAPSSPSIEAEHTSTLVPTSVAEVVALSMPPSFVPELSPAVETSVEMPVPRSSTKNVIPGTSPADAHDVLSEPVPSVDAKPPASVPTSFAPSEDDPVVPLTLQSPDLNAESGIGLDQTTNGIRMATKACGKKVRFEKSTVAEDPPSSSTVRPSLLSTPAVTRGSIEDLEGRANVLEELQKFDPDNELISPEARKISRQYDELISPEISPLVSPVPKKRPAQSAKQLAILEQVKFEQTVRLQNVVNQNNKLQKAVEAAAAATQNTIRSEAAVTNSKVDANSVKLDSTAVKLDRILSRLDEPARQALDCSRQLAFEGTGTGTDANADASTAGFVNPASLYEQAVALAKEGKEKDEIDHILFDRYESVYGPEVEKALADVKAVSAGNAAPSRSETIEATPTPTASSSAPRAFNGATLVEPSPPADTALAGVSAKAFNVASRESRPPIANGSGGAGKSTCIGNENTVSSSMRNGSKQIVGPPPRSVLSQSTNQSQRRTCESVCPFSRKNQSKPSKFDTIQEKLFAGNDKWQLHVDGCTSLDMAMNDIEVDDKSIRHFLLVRGGKRVVLKRIAELLSMNRTERRVACLSVLGNFINKLKAAAATEAGHDAAAIIISPLLKICGDRETSFVPELALEKLLLLVDVAKHHNYFLVIDVLLNDLLQLSPSMRQCEKRMGRFAAALLRYVQDLNLTEGGRVGLLKAGENIIKALRTCIHHKAASVREIGADVFCAIYTHSDLCHLAERLYKNLNDVDIKKRLRSAKLNVGK